MYVYIFEFRLLKLIEIHQYFLLRSLCISELKCTHYKLVYWYIIRILYINNLILFLFNVTRRKLNKKNDEDKQDTSITQETQEIKQRSVYRYIKLILLCCFWLIFTVSNHTDYIKQ